MAALSKQTGPKLHSDDAKYEEDKETQQKDVAEHLDRESDAKEPRSARVCEVSGRWAVWCEVTLTGRVSSSSITRMRMPAVSGN